MRVLTLVFVAALAGLLAAGLALPAVGIAGLGARTATENFWDSDIGGLAESALPEKVRLLDAGGREFASLYENNRQSVRLNQISRTMRNAVVAIEDARFYEHGAMDPKGLVRALVKNAESGQAEQGASTLTQQYVKQVLLYTAAGKKAQDDILFRRDLRQKLVELRHAVNVERNNTKDQILEKYLNVAAFGDGTYGVQAAAERYFGKPAAKLDLAEAAMLAALPQGPTRYDPTRNVGESDRTVSARLRLLKDRQGDVLDRMVKYGYATPSAAAKAKKARLPLDVTAQRGTCLQSKYPYFCEYVRFELLLNPALGKTRDQRAQAVRTGGLTVRTTLDPSMQRAAEKAIRRRVAAADRKVAASALVQPGTGSIRALAASKSFGPTKNRTMINLPADSAHSAVPNAGFQAGSTFKAFTLATALKQGKRFGDGYRSPAAFPTRSGFTDCAGSPVNDPSHTVTNASGEGSAGFYNLRSGTAQSVNVFFMMLEREVGLCEVVETAKALGIKRPDGRPLSQTPTFTLGADEMDPLTVAAAYAGIAAHGTYCTPQPFTQITYKSGRALKTRPQCRQALEPAVADATANVMTGVWTGTMKGQERPDRPAAGKTGTTDDYAAAWFAGFTPDLAIAVSLGDIRGPYAHKLPGSLIGGNRYGIVAGNTIPGPIFVDTLNTALADHPKTPLPEPDRNRFGGGRKRE